MEIGFCLQGDAETLKKYCFPEVIERCKAEHGAYQSNGIFFDNKVGNFSSQCLLLFLSHIYQTKVYIYQPWLHCIFTTH